MEIKVETPKAAMVGSAKCKRVVLPTDPEEAKVRRPYLPSRSLSLFSLMLGGRFPFSRMGLSAHVACSLSHSKRSKTT